MDSEKDKIVEYLELKVSYYKRCFENYQSPRDKMLSEIYNVIAAEIKTDMHKAQYRIGSLERFLNGI